MVTLAPVSAVKRSHFYIWIAAACCLIAFGGFMPTYWMQLPADTFNGPPIFHFHAILFSAWIVFLLFQTVLAARGQMRHHRAWGLAGIALASAMFFTGFGTAIYALHQGLSRGYGDLSRSFFIVPVSEIVLFASLFIAAIANINRPELHKRLIVLATIALLPAAVMRVVFTLVVGHGLPGMRVGFVPPAPVAIVMIATLLLETLVIAAIVFDWRTRGRPHWIWIMGLVLFPAVGLLTILLSKTPEWLGFAEYMAHFAG